MTLVLYSVSPIGLGHASRAVAVANELEGRGVGIAFATGGNAFDHISSYGFTTHAGISEPAPTVRNGEMKGAFLWYVKYWRGYRRSKATMSRLIRELKPDLVVGDEEFSGVSVALESGIKHALITDELELGFARSLFARTIERRISEWYSDLQDRVSALIIPDFGQDSMNRHYLTPMVRKVTRRREQVLEEFSLPKSGRMILLSLSGSGVGDYLMRETLKAFRDARIPDTYLALAGNRGARVSAQGIYDLGVVKENQNLVAAADLVVSNAGKSTIDEATSFGTPIIALPVRNHAEQERNAAALGYGPHDILRLRQLVVENVAKRTEPRNYAGAVRTAELLTEMATA